MTSAEDIARERWGRDSRKIANLESCFVVVQGYYSHKRRRFVEKYRSDVIKEFAVAYKDYLRVIGTMGDYTHIEYFDEMGCGQCFCETNIDDPKSFPVDPDDTLEDAEGEEDWMAKL